MTLPRQRIAILGGGPGGYEAALVAAQLGADVTVVDSDGLGGACVLTDCVPSKSLIETSNAMTLINRSAGLGIGCLRAGATKFLEPLIEAGRSSTTAVGGALAHLDCELTDAVEVADHTVFFGRVRAAWAVEEGTPLVHHRRDFRTLAIPDPEPRTERSTGCLAN